MLKFSLIALWLVYWLNASFCKGHIIQISFINQYFYTLWPFWFLISAVFFKIQSDIHCTDKCIISGWVWWGFFWFRKHFCLFFPMYNSIFNCECTLYKARIIWCVAMTIYHEGFFFNCLFVIYPLKNFPLIICELLIQNLYPLKHWSR